MNALALKKIIAGILIASLSTGFVAAQSMSLSVATKTYYGGYSPKHVMACWITNSAGTYVYAMKRYGSKYFSSLTNWTAVSSSNKNTDGSTSATLNSHSTVTLTWNCKNSSSVVVPDGTYYINLEFTEQEGTKQFVKYSFVKGTTSKTSSAPTIVTANSYYTSPLLVYTAPAVALSTPQASSFDFIYLRSDRSLQLDYDAVNHSKVELRLVNLKGQTVHQVVLKGLGKESTQLPAVACGIYLIRLTDSEGWSQTKKIVL